MRVLREGFIHREQWLLWLEWGLESRQPIPGVTMEVSQFYPWVLLLVDLLVVTV
jgi:hypothetical protein